MHQFVTVHNLQHASKTTGVLFEKVKIRSLFKNSTDCGGAGRSSNFLSLLSKQWQCRCQSEDGSAYSQSSLHKTDLWMWQVFLFVTQTNFKRKSVKWSKHGNAWGHFCISFQAVTMHLQWAHPHVTAIWCYCISNLQRGSRKQLLSKKLQLTTWNPLFQSGVKKHAPFTITKKILGSHHNSLPFCWKRPFFFCCTPQLLTPALRRTTWSHSFFHCTDMQWVKSSIWF